MRIFCAAESKGRCAREADHAVLRGGASGAAFDPNDQRDLVIYALEHAAEIMARRAPL
jgi:hypothetical protein